MPGKPYQSCLTPYMDEIVALRRRKPPMPYSQIADLLRDKYHVTVRRGTIYSFVKIRSKESYKNKVCKHAWKIELKNSTSQSITETPSLQKQTAIQTPKPPVSDYSKSPVAPVGSTGNKNPKPFEYEYSQTYNLHRLTPEEAEAYRKQLEKELENQ